jgi:hypothetical protein
VLLTDGQQAEVGQVDRQGRQVLGYWVLAAVALPLLNPVIFVLLAIGMHWIPALILVSAGTCLLLGFVARRVWSEGAGWRTALGTVEAIALSALVLVIAVFIALDNCDGCLS